MPESKLGNKEIMARNLRYYMEQKEVNSSDVCKALGFKQNTYSNWINAKIYPRIDKIEMMAAYFGVTKADLVEERLESFETPEEFELHWYRSGGGTHPIKLTPVEHEIILAYRAADSSTQNNICKILDVKKDSTLSKEA
jgi:transcriptional regulator with XRE-family HTH domain